MRRNRDESASAEVVDMLFASSESVVCSFERRFVKRRNDRQKREPAQTPWAFRLDWAQVLFWELAFCDSFCQLGCPLWAGRSIGLASISMGSRRLRAIKSKKKSAKPFFYVRRKVSQSVQCLQTLLLLLSSNRFPAMKGKTSKEFVVALQFQ